ncbi:hypothetical protein [Gordonia jinhuaensis]
MKSVSTVSRPWMTLMVAALAVVLAMVGSAGVASGAPVRSGPTFLPGAQATSSGCGWKAVPNALYPDLNARYWQVSVPLKQGQQIRLDGRFPHARYMAVALQGAGSGSGDAIHDSLISPAAGSTNPFVVGADRNATARSYQLSVVPAAVPATCVPNTLYTGSAKGGQISILYRIYQVDHDVDEASGGAGFPSVTVVDSNETTVSTCSANNPTLVAPATFASLPPVAAAGIGAFGTNPPTWQKFINAQTSYAQLLRSDLLGDSAYSAVTGVTAKGAAGGLGANVDNQYVTTLLNPHYGKVLVVTATMPTFPATGSGQSPMGSGQVRYWSMCSEKFATTQAVACLADESIPLDAQRHFTVVVSAPADRPRYATPACGVAWLPASTSPGTALVMRNLLADASFTQSIAHATLNHESDTMGAYYPSGRYLADAAEFDAGGCHPA